MKIEKPKRKFKGVWIPKQIWETKELSTVEKVVLAEIDSLSDAEEGCFASNKYFAGFFGLSSKRISFIINKLVKRGFVKMEIDVKAGNKRKLWACPEKYPKPIPESADTPIPENGDTPYPRKRGKGRPESADTPIPENGDQDNTDNTIESKKDKGGLSFKGLSVTPGEAYLLLRQYGVREKTATSIVYEQGTPPTSIVEVIKNGLAKEKFENSFTLKPGYIVAALKQARKEGKVIGPTKKSRLLKRTIEDKKKPRKVMSKKEFDTKKTKQLKLLTAEDVGAKK